MAGHGVARELANRHTMPLTLIMDWVDGIPSEVMMSGEPVAS